MSIRPAPNCLIGSFNFELTSSMYWFARINSIFSILTCDFSSLIFFVYGSSFFTGLLAIYPACAAYTKV